MTGWWPRIPDSRRGGGFFGTLHAFDDISYRPGQYLYHPLVHTLFGLHMKVFLAWAALCAVAMSVAFYAFLRVQGMRRLESGAVATLVLLFPYSSSTRLWSTAAVTSVAVLLYLVGTLLVLRALSGRSSHPLLLHGAGLATVLCGVMTYEVVAPAALLSVVFYVRVTPLRQAIASWLVDVALIGAILAFITSGRHQDVATVGDQLSHAWVIAQQSLDLWARVLLPFGAPPTWLAVGLLLGVVIAAVAFAHLSRLGGAVRRDLLRWLFTLAGGIVAIAVGYAMFVPADPYYSPSALGIGDRTNVFAALGWAVVAVAFVRLVATIALRDMRRSRTATAVAVAVAVTAIGLGYADRLRTEADAYAASFGEQATILDTMHATLPNPPNGSTIYVARHLPWTAPGVPVFVQWWEFFGAVRITYGDRSLWGYPIVPPGTSLTCGPKTVETSPAPYGAAPRYGRAFVLDMASRIMSPLTDRATCRRVVGAVGLSPVPPA